MGTSINDWEPALKEVYTKKVVQVLSFTDNPLLGILPKQRSGGDYFVQPLHTQAPGGGSASLALAKTNGYGSRVSKLHITRAKMFQRVAVNLELMLAGEKPEDSMINVTKEFDNGFKELASKVERRLFRSSTGSIGRVKANTTVASTTIILTDRADAFNVQIGDSLRFSTTDGGAVHAGGTASGVAVVTGVDTDAGTITAGTADLSAEAQMATGDYISIGGDLNACVAGLESWLPVTDRSTKLAASFFGLTRSTLPVRLGGVYVNGVTMGGDANDILIELASRIGEQGGKPDIVFCGTKFFGDLARTWITTRQGFENVMVSAKSPELTISRLYPGMRALVGGFMMTIVPTRNCPSNRVYMLQRDTWTIHHTGSNLPCFAMEQIGGDMLRIDTWSSGQTDFEVEAWLAGYGNLGCEAPGKNGVALVPTA